MKNRGPSTDPSSPNPSSICWLQTQCIWWRAGAKYWSFSHSFFNLLIEKSMNMMKSRGPSTDPSPTPSSVHWLHTPCIGRRAGGQVVILLPLPIQSVDCKLNAYHEEQGPKYWYFSHSSFGPLIAKSMNMMKSRGPSTDPSPTPYSVRWLQTPCNDEEQGAKYWYFFHSFFSLLISKSMHMMKSRGQSTDPSSTHFSKCWLQTPCIWWAEEAS